MKKSLLSPLLAAGVCLTTLAIAQQPFTNCAAAFVGNKMVVDSYTPKAHCQLSGKATGLLTVQTVELSSTQAKAVDKIDFKVAIRDKATGTLHLFSGETYKQLPVQDVLTACKKGDHIVLLTVDNHYALPHNEIVVQ
ncbi:hypothetical protein [Fibrella aquatilis]|uniref:Uncharacterized protein n=1 Tax=Fibrella aquatilis TaxID=2817059 RepID=A0A939G1V5_9BACT|nr:hypothetical protein [Fibrella aquatilis]MBO0930867.1 hypothetical protein [Fibrella aquatilis]